MIGSFNLIALHSSKPLCKVKKIRNVPTCYTTSCTFANYSEF